MNEVDERGALAAAGDALIGLHRIRETAAAVEVAMAQIITAIDIVESDLRKALATAGRS